MTTTSIPWYREDKLYYTSGTLVADFGTTVQGYGYNVENNWKVSVDTGEFVPNIFRVNPYFVARERAHGASSDMLTVRYYFGTYYRRYVYTGPLVLTFYPNAPIVKWDKSHFARELTILNQKANAKIGSSLHGFGEELGEFKETLQMLRNPFKSLRNFFFKDRSRNLTILRECLRMRRSPTKIVTVTGKTVADTWLELRYGLRPLVLSIQSIVGLILKRQEELDANRIRTARTRMSLQRKDKGKSLSSSPTLNYLLAGLYSVDSTIRLESIVYYRQKTELSLSRKLGLGLANLPETAWELTRLSFVVDWFLTIGPFLGSIRYNPDFEILGATESVRVSQSGIISCQLKSDLGIYTLETDNVQGTAEYSREYFDRSLRSNKPSLPQFRGLAALDIPKIADGLALILSAVWPKLR